MFVLGTAGHVDHGKSKLVEALTGIDPDRLAEEKKRGMTIDLGFAWLKLPSGREVGIVDVPGHERFIKNMLAGVGGIDLALLVVAADEGVMPQTREHLAILDLLEVKRGLVVITKKDLVDSEILELVTLEIEEAIKPTALRGSPVLAVSAMTGEGLPQLLAAIDRILDTTQPRKDIGRPRLPIDRIFTIAGAGTVVTGTLIDGSLSVGDEVEIMPSGLRARLRSLQTHKVRVTQAGAGSRVAANLVGVSTSELQRGDVVARPGTLGSSTVLTGRLRLLPHMHRPLPHNATVSFHTLTAEAAAKVRLLTGNELEPGGSALAQFLLDRPVAALRGDRFIIRSTEDTLGGGSILEVHLPKRRRHRTPTLQSLEAREKGTPAELLMSTLSTRQPLSWKALLNEAGMELSEVESALKELVSEGRAVAVGEGQPALFFTREGWRSLSQKAASILEEYHGKFPIRSSMPKSELASRLKLGEPAPLILEKLSKDGVLVVEGAGVRLPSHRARLTPQQQEQIETFTGDLRRNPYAPSSQVSLDRDLIELLVEQGRIVKVSSDVVFLASAYDDMVGRVIARLKEKDKITLAEVRDLFNTSRKYAQALLEHLDERGITRRVGDERILR